MTEHETMLDLFAHPGWDMFMQDMEEMQGANLSTIINIDEANEFFKFKGRLEILNTVVNYDLSYKTE